jgi:hypothetical protein
MNYFQQRQADIALWNKLRGLGITATHPDQSPNITLWRQQMAQAIGNTQKGKVSEAMNKYNEEQAKAGTLEQNPSSAIWASEDQKRAIASSELQKQIDSERERQQSIIDLAKQMEQPAPTFAPTQAQQQLNLYQQPSALQQSVLRQSALQQRVGTPVTRTPQMQLAGAGGVLQQPVAPAVDIAQQRAEELQQIQPKPLTRITTGRKRVWA